MGKREIGSNETKPVNLSPLKYDCKKLVAKETYQYKDKRKL